MIRESQARSRTLEVHRDEILTEGALIVAICAVLVVMVSESAPLQLTTDPALQFAFSVLAVLSGAIILLGTGIFAAKRKTSRRLRFERDLKTPAVEVLTSIARGEADSAALEPLYDRAPDLVEEVLTEALGAQKGIGRERLAAAAEDLGIVDGWRRLTESSRPQVRCAAIVRLGLLPNPRAEEEFRKGMEDEEELVALESARALIRTGSREVIGNVLFGLRGQTRLVRALLCEWLRPNAVSLATSALPEMLRSSDLQQVLTALEAIASWRRALLLPDVQPLLSHPRPEIRTAAWAVAAYVLGFELTADDLHSALASEYPAVRAAAWSVAGRMRLASAPAGILAGMNDPDGEVALAACYAAAALGLRAELERVAVSGIAPANAFATEALEKLMIGRLER